MHAIVHLQRTVFLNGVRSTQTHMHVSPLFAPHLLDDLRRFSTIGGSHADCPCLFPSDISITVIYDAPFLLLYAPYLFLLYYSCSSSPSFSFLFQSLFLLDLKCFRLCLSMCLSPLSLLSVSPPPLSPRQSTGMATPDCVYF